MNTIEVIKSSKENGVITLHTEKELDMNTLHATSYMIVDSDALAFVYLVDTDTERLYVKIPTVVWEDLKEEQPVYLVSGEQSLLLTGFHEELAYLTQNIQGNGNYPQDLEKAVVKTFLS